MKKLLLSLILILAAMPIFSQTRKERLTGHVYYFAADSLRGRKAGSEDAAKAAAYIVREYSSMGLKPFFDDWYMPFTKGGNDYKNVVAVLEGNDPVLKNEYIVVGAHYDHLGVKNGEVYNGADDNASGSASVIELARALCEHRDELKRTVVIAAFDAEELGLYGSTALARKMIDEDGLDVRLMMSVDMVGWYRAKDCLTLEGVSTIKDGRRVLQSEKLNLKLIGFEKSVLTATDTEGFAKRNVPTLAVTTGLKSPYHKPGDDAELIDYDGLDRVTDYLADLTLEVATDKDFSPSGKVARKHRDGIPVFEAGIALAAGNSSFRFPDAAFKGKRGFTYGAGLTAQLNFGHDSRFAVKAEPTFLMTSAKYPDVTEIYSSSLKYEGRELVVPVQFIFQSKGGYIHYGLGGYYGHRFKATLPENGTIRTDDYGISAGFGLKFGGYGISFTWMDSLRSLFEEKDAPSARQGTNLIRLYKWF